MSIVTKLPGQSNATADCSRCRRRVPVRFVWQRFANQSRHIRAECRVCGVWLAYVPQHPETVQLADQHTTEQTREQLRELIGGAA